MLSLCEQYSTDFNVIFNVSKNKLTVFGRKVLNVNVVSQGKIVFEVNNEVHVVQI